MLNSKHDSDTLTLMTSPTPSSASLSDASISVHSEEEKSEEEKSSSESSPHLVVCPQPQSFSPSLCSHSSSVWD